MNEHEPPLPISDPQPEERNLGQKYDQLYSQDAPVFGGGRPLEIVKRISDVLPGGTALDIGAGEGRHSLFLARNAFKVTAFDLSSVGMDKLKQVASAENLKVDAHVGDALQLRWEQHYDVIVCSFVLHHLEQQRALTFISQIQQSTNPNGLNAIAVFTKEGDFSQQDFASGNFYPELGELRSLYDHWKILEYSEEEGEAFNRHPDGRPMRNTYAMILAQKI